MRSDASPTPTMTGVLSATLISSRLPPGQPCVGRSRGVYFQARPPLVDGDVARAGGRGLATITAEDRVALTDSLSRLLTDMSGEADVRRVMETPEGYDPALWRQLAEMGIVGLILDERFGGVGAGPVEL